MKVKKVLLHVIVLVLVFAASIGIIARVLNQGSSEETSDMAEATFPLVYMLCGDSTQMNCLHGYAQEMPVQNIRDSITPLNSDRSLNIQIESFNCSIDSMTYQVITTDGQETLEKTKITRTKENGKYIDATLEMQNKMLMNQEYILQIQINVGERIIYYYTRIILQDSLYAEDYVNFVTGFYERCLNKTDLSTIASSMEPTDVVLNNNLATVTINASVDEVSWGSLNPQVYYKPIPSIKELNENTASIVLDYMISSINENKEEEYYHVTEFYRVRYTDTRVFLLNFNRFTNQVLNADNDIMTAKGIDLGIADRAVQYAYDTNRKVIAFVQEHELWTYNTDNGGLTQVFSFYQKDKIDQRDFYGQHSIKIVNVDSNGDVFFLVTGYMNRGFHEGESGVAVYFYDASTGNVEEKAFIDSRESYRLLERNVNSLSYISSSQNSFYLMIGENVYEVNLDLMVATPVIEGVKEGCHAQSESGKYFAWLKENKAYDSQTICVMDMDTKAIREFSCADSERVRIEGFIGDHLIYGVADSADINTVNEGAEFFPMKNLGIQDQEGNEVKTYQADGYYVTDVTVASGLVTLTRVKRNGDTYEPAQEDHIVENTEEQSTAYGVTTQISDVKQMEIVLMVGENLKDKVPQVIRSRQVTLQDSKNVTIDPVTPSENLYYVYAEGKLNSIYSNANAAIKKADEMVGVVVDYNQNYIWERGNKVTQTNIAVDKVPASYLTSALTQADLQAATGLNIINLSGCTLDEVLYFVSEGHPVVAQTAEGPVVITGYNELNTLLLRSGATASEYYGMQDSTALFEAAGNVFFASLD